MAVVKQLILASSSPFRRSLLASTGLSFVVQTTEVDEAAIRHAEPRELARLRALAKAQAVAALPAATDALIIGADQVLSLDDLTFDKAPDAATAHGRLVVLAGRSHYLHSAFVLISTAAGRPPQLLHQEVIDVCMTMRALSAADIAAYVATEEWRGCVGCYQFEERGVHLFAGVDSDHSHIVGLPLQPLLAALRRHGIDGLAQPTPPWPLRIPG